MSSHNSSGSSHSSSSIPSTTSTYTPYVTYSENYGYNTPPPPPQYTNMPMYPPPNPYMMMPPPPPQHFQPPAPGFMSPPSSQENINIPHPQSIPSTHAGGSSSQPQTVDDDPTDIWLHPDAPPHSNRKSKTFQYYILSKDNQMAKCRTCGKIYKAPPGGGTSHLTRHSEGCGRPASDPSQPRISASHPSGFTYNYERDRDELGKMLVHSETPFLFSENDAFNHYITTALQPMHKQIGRKTVASSAMKNYLKHKEKLIFELGCSSARVSLTADAWDGGFGLHYLCVTAHWVDIDWVLQKRIIHFQMLEWPHSALNISHHLLDAIETYSLRDRIMSMTFDNASAMTGMANMIKGNLRDPLLDEQALHLRCACHVLNLCVQDGVRAISPHLRKIRGAVLFINSSGARLQEWKAALRQSQVRPVKIPSDVETRWNSTYVMLNKCLKYKDHLERFYNTRFPQNAILPSDWALCEKYMGFLQLLYTMTHCFSTVYQPCSHSFLNNACLLVANFAEHRDLEDYNNYIPLMEEKWRKYYTRIPDIYIFASILDPRLKFTETYSFIDIYWNALNLGTDVEREQYKESITNKFDALYQAYQNKFGGTTRSERPAQSGSGKKAKGLFSMGANLKSKFSSGSGSSRQPQSDMTELYLYKNFDYMSKMDDDEKAGLDILQWWKSKENKQPILAAMARDLLGIQVSSVASERAFSASGRVLDDRRSRLNAKTLEMCVCYKDWLDAEIRAQDGTYEMNDNDDGYGTSDTGSSSTTTSSQAQSAQLFEDLEDDSE